MTIFKMIDNQVHLLVPCSLGVLFFIIQSSKYGYRMHLDPIIRTERPKYGPQCLQIRQISPKSSKQASGFLFKSRHFRDILCLIGSTPLR